MTPAEFFYTPLERRALLMGLVSGSAAIVMYLSRTFLPLPHAISIGAYILFGPALVFAFIGLFPLYRRPEPTLAAYVATVTGILAGAINMMFAVVQLNNLHFLRPLIANAPTPELKAEWQHILRGVFTVQNGLNFTMDFFLDLSAFLWAFVMWRHPAFGKWVSILSVALVGPHFVMKFLTFPTPPAEAGMFDAGPLVGIWFTVMTVMATTHYLKTR